MGKNKGKGAAKLRRKQNYEKYVKELNNPVEKIGFVTIPTKELL